MNEFEVKEIMKNRKFSNNTRYDYFNWLINFVSEHIENTMGGIKDKIMHRFQTNTAKDYSKPPRVENIYCCKKKPMFVCDQLD